MDNDGNYWMVVENYKGGENKYEVNKEYGVIGLDRVLHAPMPFSFEYGFIPGTWNEEDDDPVDIIALMNTSTFPGCLLNVRPIGMFKLDDTGEEDNKILAVSTGDPAYEGVDDVKDVPERTLKKIEFFWENYKKMTPDKFTEGKGWESRDVAIEYVKKAIDFYAEKFSEKTAE